jgi:hypothetical protein
MEIYDDDGRRVLATFHAQFENEQPTVRFDACGGPKDNRINGEYNFGLQLVLQRLGLGGACLLRVLVESDKTRELPDSERQVTIDQAEYPIDLTRWANFFELRKGIGRGCARIGRDPESNSDGNRQKQLRLYVQFPAPTPVTERWLNALISQRPTQEDDEVQTSTEAAADGSVTTRVSYPRTAGGQGRSTNALRNRAVEEHAMNVAQTYFASEAGGAWKVANVASEKRGYDLKCTRGDEELYVEVKGTINAGDSVILTRNEVNHAHADPERNVLFVAYLIDAREQDGQWRCEGGERRVLRNWDPYVCGRLEPEQYKYTLPRWSDGE